jgi:hypothetical protein
VYSGWRKARVAILTVSFPSMDLTTLATTYCDVNDITCPPTFREVILQLESLQYTNLIARCTLDFFAHGVRQLAHKHIDEEQFFLMGDIWSTTVLKQPRPHLDALDQMLHDLQPQTLYVIDGAAEVAFSHRGWSLQNLQAQLHVVGSAYICF